MLVAAWLALSTLIVTAAPERGVSNTASPAPSTSPPPSVATHFRRRLAVWPQNDYDQGPRMIKQTKPVYPKKPFADGIEGTVEIEIMIDETGRVADLQIVRSIPGLDQAAVDCVKQWRFVAARKAGQSVASVASAPVTFRITERKR